MDKFKPFNSSHEGFAVLKEEVDELWDAIKSNDLSAAQKEAIQVAAMALPLHRGNADDEGILALDSFAIREGVVSTSPSPLASVLANVVRLPVRRTRTGIRRYCSGSVGAETSWRGARAAGALAGDS